MSYNYLLIHIILNLIIILYFNKISKIYNIYDSADGIRKLQKNPVSLVGGTIIFFNFIFLLLINYIFDLKILEEKFLDTNREFFSLVFGSVLFYIFGVLDDKHNLKPNIKLFTIFFITLLLVMMDENLVITKLNFSNIEHVIELNIFSYFFTILCFLLFINALNMFDGINLQSGFYSVLVMSIFVIKNIIPLVSLTIIVSLIFFLYLNYKNKTFLGESGVQFLAFIISYVIIKSYNSSDTLFFVDEIFIIMALPGLELLRLFLIRVAKGRHPFKGDREHLHHLLLKILNPTQTFVIIFLSILISILIFYIVEYKILYLIFFSILYSLTIVYLKKSN